jgi:hypothetical protein
MLAGLRQGFAVFWIEHEDGGQDRCRVENGQRRLYAPLLHGAHLCVVGTVVSGVRGLDRGLYNMLTRNCQGLGQFGIHFCCTGNQ